MTQIIQTTVNGLTNGSLYSLVALSLVIITRASGVLNFGVGYMATFVGVFSANFWVGGSFVTLIVSLLLAGGLGVACFLLAVNLAEKKGAGHASLGIVALGFGIVIEYFCGKLWLQQGYSPPPLIDGGILLGDVAISNMRIMTVVVAIGVFVLISLIFEKSMLGWALESIAFRRDTALLYGVNIFLILGCVWFLGGMLAGLAGILQAPIYQISLPVSIPLAVKGFTAVVIGGTKKIEYALYSSFAIAFLESTFVTLLSSVYSNALIFCVLFVGLATKPEGVFMRRKKLAR